MLAAVSLLLVTQSSAIQDSPVPKLYITGFRIHISAIGLIKELLYE
jgi:hypothetical protein